MDKTLNYRIIDGAETMRMEEIMALLGKTYWANSRSQEQVELSMKNSRCFGVYLEDEEKQVGFARVISDYATTYYLCDELSTRNIRTVVSVQRWWDILKICRNIKACAVCL